MYHLELRQFPHNLCRFNLTEQELRALLAPWVLDKPLELGERKWSPHQATVTVLEGPRLKLQQLSMGRGWRAAQREGEDVTARVIAATSEAVRAAATQPQAQSPAGSSAPGSAQASAAQARSGSHVDAAALADPLALGVQLASLLGDDPTALLAAWRALSAQKPGLSPSETLAMAEESLGLSRPGPG
jgi:hypothetical protein